MAASSKWSRRWPGCGPTRSSPISTGTAIPRRPPFPSPSTRRSGPGGWAAAGGRADAPADVRENKGSKGVGDFSIQGVVARLTQDFGARPLDIVVHSLANAPEVKQPLIDTSRRGYLEALSVSAYSNIAFVRSLGPLMRPDGSFLALTYMAGERGIPGYGGGMSSAEAALAADTRTLAYEAGL